VVRSIKIAVIGNSVGLRVRPPQPHPENKTYSQLLHPALLERGYDHVLIENHCVGRSTVRQVLELGDNITHAFLDVYIVNCGVTDCSTREIPLWFSDLIFSSRTSFLRNIAAAIHKFIIIPNRKTFVRLRGKRSWLRPQQFRRYYKKLISDLLKNTNAVLILMSINDTTDRVESELPGTRANIERFNAVIRQLAQIDPARIRLVETGDLDPETDLPDGVHFSRQGHDKMNERLLREILEFVTPRQRRAPGRVPTAPLIRAREGAQAAC
jgi:hypothetical protein